MVALDNCASSPPTRTGCIFDFSVALFAPISPSALPTDRQAQFLLPEEEKGN